MSRTPLILTISNRMPANTPRYGTLVARAAASCKRVMDNSNVPPTTPTSGDWRISRGGSTLAEVGTSRHISIYDQKKVLGKDK